MKAAIPLIMLSMVILFAGCGQTKLAGENIQLKTDSRPQVAVKAKQSSKASKRTLELGDCGVDVLHLNQRLIEQKFLPATWKTTIRSCFEDYTYHALIAFQKWHQLQADGTFGSESRQQLLRDQKPQLKNQSKLSGDRIFILLRRQVLITVNNGRLQQIIAVSTAAPGYSTPIGTHSIYRKEEMSWSIPYSVWLPYASYFIGGVAMHEYHSVPTYPASHGCVRVPEPFAQRLYRFADLGMVVKVI